MSDISTQAIFVLYTNFDMKVSRAWLQTYFDDELPDAEQLSDVFTFHSFEVEGVERVGDDWVIDLDILPNRSSDCLSHRGVARELATLLQHPMKREPLRDSVPNFPEAKHLKVVIDDHRQCRRYMGALVRGVTVQDSPTWLKDALERIGQRPINNIVDATNYVMFDIGQPLHVFDRAKLHQDNDGTMTIGVRSARKGEEITVLTGETYEVTEDDLLITDAVANKPLAIAGIKGGSRAEISADTVDIVLEAAHFNFAQVRTSSRRLKLATDASLRFQNDPAPELPAFAMRDVLNLITEVAGGTPIEVYDAYSPKGERTPVDVTLHDINRLLGTSLTIDEVERILVRFEWEFSRDREEFAITPPWERSDLAIREDIIEEIGRVYGLRELRATLPNVPSSPPTVTKSQYYTDLLRAVCTSLGYTEVLTYTLHERGEVELANPLASDKAFLRMNLRDGVAKALIDNVPHAPLLGLDDIKVFEIGTRFTREGEELAFAIGVQSVNTKVSKLLAALQKDIAVIEAELGVKLNLNVVDGIAETALDTALATVARPKAYRDALPWNTKTRFRSWSAYPYVLRDIAVWVPDNVPLEEVLKIVLEQGDGLLVQHKLFDTFQNDKRTSYAWHLVFQSMDHTLTDEEVNVVMEKLTSTLNTKKEWEVR